MAAKRARPASSLIVVSNRLPFSYGRDKDRAVAEAIRVAHNMPADEREARMRRMRRSIRRQDFFWWVDSFLRAAISRGLRHSAALAPRGKDADPENQLPL